MPEQPYDKIGVGYARLRRPDPRVATLISHALGECDSVLNVGAGTGSYEPDDRTVVAVEPAMTMIRQRPTGSAPAVRTSALALPFGDRMFGAALAVLTLHHWRDWRAGLSELLRVTRERIIVLTWDPTSTGFWLVQDYFPDVLEADRRRFPPLDSITEVLGTTDVLPVRIPHDCVDGFMGAYWRRPSAYLDDDVRGSISSFASTTSTAILARLRHDLDTGAWRNKHGHLLGETELDIGYRLVVSIRGANVPLNRGLQQTRCLAPPS